MYEVRLTPQGQSLLIQQAQRFNTPNQIARITKFVSNPAKVVDIDSFGRYILHFKGITENFIVPPSSIINPIAPE